MNCSISNGEEEEEEGPGRPIQLVYTDESGRFKINPEAIVVLRRLKGPLAVISVCGPPRQGKSFLLNQILGIKRNGFRVGSTSRPCTKGLWMWSSPVKRIALDGTQYNLLLLDTEGLNADDQTVTNSHQIFSLAIFVSSLCIYNQIGGIDEGALDHLQIVTKMTKLIRLRDSGEANTLSELGYFSPTFVWLVRDFLKDLVEAPTPRDYLESALRPVLSDRKDITEKNKIGKSICSFLPDRECFTLAPPVNNEADLQHLDRSLLENLRPEFVTGLDVLVKFVFERTKPKQIGTIILTGPVLAGIIKYFLDALNEGVVPTVSSCWQSAEKVECRRAFETAKEAYMSVFDRSKPPDEVSLRDAHGEAVEKSVSVFDSSAIGSSLAREHYRVLLQNFLRQAFEDYKRNAFMEADLRCSKTIESMTEKLHEAFQITGAKIGDVFMALDGLLGEYVKSSHGPAKWQKLSLFLQKSLQDIIMHYPNKQMNDVLSENNKLLSHNQSILDQMESLKKQLNSSQKLKNDYQKHYEDAINDMKKLSDDYTTRITSLESKCSSLRDNLSCLAETVEPVRQDSLEWRRKFEEISTRDAGDMRATTEISVLKEIQARAAWKEANEWKVKYENVLREAEEWKSKYEIGVKQAASAMEKEMKLLKNLEQAQHRENVFKAELSSNMETKVKEAYEWKLKYGTAQDEANDWKTKYESSIREVEVANEYITNLQESSKEAQLKYEVLSAELSSRLEEKENDIRGKMTKLTCAEQRLATLSIELQNAKSKIEQYSQASSDLKLRMKQLEENYTTLKSTAETTEKEAKRLEHEKTKLEQKYLDRLIKSEEAFESSKAELVSSAQHEKRDLQQEQIKEIEKLRIHIEGEAEKKQNLQLKITTLEAMIEAREQEIRILKMENELNSLPDHMSPLAKRSRLEVVSMPSDSAQSTDEHETKSDKKKGLNPRKCSTAMMEEASSIVVKREEGNNSVNLDAVTEDYTKFTIKKLRMEILNAGLGSTLVGLQSPRKKDYVALYEQYVLHKGNN